MSTITGPTTTPGVPTTAPAPSTPSTTEPGIVLPPVYSQTFTGLGDAIRLGLSQPRNLGDLEAIFSEIATKLQETAGETQDNAKLAESEGRRTQAQDAASVVSQLLDWANNIEAHRDNIKKEEAKIVVYNAELSALAAEKGGLDQRKAWEVNKRDGAAQAISNLNGRVNTINNTDIPYYQGLINGAKSDDPRIPGWQNQINALQNERSNIQNNLLPAEHQRYNEAVAEIGNIDRRLGEIEARTNELNDLKAASEAEIKRSENAIESLLGSYANIVTTIMNFIFSIFMGDAGHASRTVGETGAIVQDFDQALQQAIGELSDLSEWQLDREFMSRGAEEGVDGADTGTALQGPELQAVGFALALQTVAEALGDLLGAFGVRDAEQLGSEGAGRVRVAI